METEVQVQHDVSYLGSLVTVSHVVTTNTYNDKPLLPQDLEYKV